MNTVSGKSSNFEDKLFSQRYTIQINGRLIDMSSPKLMGIVNLTPDSFFKGNRAEKSIDKVAKLVATHIQHGADILDLGGYSSRSGADEVSVQQEIDRVIPAIQWINENYPTSIISVDTFRASVAQAAIEAGAHIVNDISAGELDEDMIPTVSKLNVPYIAMHMRGNPKTMQQKTNYSDILGEMLYYFAEKLDTFEKHGINDVILDPGFGFAKTLEQNFYVLKHLSEFKFLSKPLLVGISRKSMISKLLNISTDDALNGTTALNMFALCQGANILRVHDVKEANETINLYNTLYS